MRTLILILMLLISIPCNAAILHWSAPTTYSDGSAIGPEGNQLTYHPYYGPSPTGPWTPAPTTQALDSTMPDPNAGETMWYTVSASIGTNPEGAKAGAVSKTVPFPQITDPDAPSGLWVE